jgi:hypothetical protein
MQCQKKWQGAKKRGAFAHKENPTGRADKKAHVVKTLKKAPALCHRQIAEAYSHSE